MQNTSPKVSVIMAFHNAVPYLADAIASVLAQSHAATQLILSDDGSTDDSRACAEEAAASDKRVRLVTGPQGGPAVARNRALDVADGDWIGVVDADDLLHPARIERLLARADALGADMIADDLVHFGAETGRSLLQPLSLDAPLWVDAKTLLSADMRTLPVSLGYLKPLIRRDVMGDARYRPELTIGEDFDFLLRLSLGGARLAVVPEAYYLYRRHSSSISHRLSEQAARAMAAALPSLDGEFGSLIAARRGWLEREADYAQLVTRLKSRDLFPAAGQIARTPSLLRPLWRSFRDGRARAHTAEAPTKATLHLSAEPGPDGVPATPEGWQLDDVLALVAKANGGGARVHADGKAGLEALGYVPGWAEATLVAPQGGWSAEEARVIAALPWPVAID